MKVICRQSELSPAQRTGIGLAGQTNQYYLEQGEVHTVLGMTCSSEAPSGVILDIPGERYIIPAPLCLFDIVDERPSRFWRARACNEQMLRIWPEELYIKFFHARLSDFDPEITAIYRELCARMESEFG
jgi:hypothetical protein